MLERFAASAAHFEFFKGPLRKGMILYRTISCLNGSLHGETVLHTDGERAVYGCVYNFFSKWFYIAPKGDLLLLQA